MKSTMKGLIKRIIAGTLTVCILFSMSQTALAEEQQVPSAVVAQKPEATQENSAFPEIETIQESIISNEAEKMVNTSTSLEEENATEDSASLESEATAESMEILESIVTSEQNVSVSGNGTEEMIEEELAFVPMLLGAGISESLTLDNALSLAQEYNSGQPIIQKEGTEGLKIYNGEGLILLSNVMPGAYQNRDITLCFTSGQTSVYDVTSTLQIGDQSFTFCGLSSADCPYQGKFSFDTEGNAPIYTESTLFVCLSTDATLNDLKFQLVKGGNGLNTNLPLLADRVVAGGGTADWQVELTGGNESGTPKVIIGGIIGTLEENAKAKVTLTNNYSGNLTVTGSGNTGLFCNTMATGSNLNPALSDNNRDKIAINSTAYSGGFVGYMTSSTLTVMGSGASTVSTENSNADAGGIVGHMEGGILNVSGTLQCSVTSKNSDAGGLVGSAKDAVILAQSVAENGNSAPTTVDLSGVKVTADNNGKSAGGLAGYYNFTQSSTIDLSNFNFGTNNYDTNTFEALKLVTSGNAGGAFGCVKNTSSAASLAITGTTISSVKSDGSGTYGGLIGMYQCDTSIQSTLDIKNIVIQTANSTSSSNIHGGVIGRIQKNSRDSYVVLSGITTQMYGMGNTIGGLVGEMQDGLLNVGNVTVTSDSLRGNNAVGGLVGSLSKGVLRLHGITDLSQAYIDVNSGGNCGQIVGNNSNGLVYATGTGENGEENTQTGWTFKRFINKSDKYRFGSDIGTWGEVVRLDGTKLKETTATDNKALIKFDETAHTITVQSGFGEVTNNAYNIQNICDFAAYALTFDLYNENQSSSVLKFATKVDYTQTQNVTLSTDIDLTGTGILGIGRDNISIEYWGFGGFFGSFNGGDKTVTLDFGGKYGMVGTSKASELSSGNALTNSELNKAEDVACGQLYTSGNGHNALGLFAGVNTKNVTSKVVIQNVIINGSIDVINKGGNTCRSANVVAYQIGEAEYTSVTTSASIDVRNYDSEGNEYVQAGLVADAAGDSTITLDSCTWNAPLTNTRSTENTIIGGAIGRTGNNSTVSVTNSTLQGTITANSISGNAQVGGLVATTGSGSNITISKLSITGAEITVSNANNHSGGLMGYQWQTTDVNFDAGTESYGVEISGSKLNASSAVFGGLVYQATGYWNATADNSIKFTGNNTFLGKSTKSTPSGLLVGTGLNGDNALYLEIGTYGRASDDTAYSIADNAVTLSIGESEYFDELVGTTIKDKNYFSGKNAVVSLETSTRSIDSNGCNTYKSQLKPTGNVYKNECTRYYYNLNKFREQNTDTSNTTGATGSSLTTPGNVVLWSVSRFAGSNIDKYFYNGSGTVTISGDIDLTHYSYYPVSVSTGVELSGANLTFGYEVVENVEDKASNKKPSDSEHQHYLMQHGLLYDASDLKVTDTTLAGTVAMFTSSGSTKCGALIMNTTTSDDNYSSTRYLTIQDVTLNGLRVSGVDAATPYAPLLVNTMKQGITVKVDNLSTGVGYTSTEGGVTTTQYAATSLFGNVGHDTAEKLSLTFSNIALDGRKASTGNTTKVYNNGTVEIDYHTTHAIFTHATLLESLTYLRNSSGVYNFNSTDNKVTYGVELTNSGTIGRNPDKQYKYYDAGYITHIQNKTATEDTVKTDYSSENFIRYVYTVEDGITKHELDINQKVMGLIEGCGTYGDPYLITDGGQLEALAKYLNENTRSSATGFKVTINSKVIEEQKQTQESYHKKGQAVSLESQYGVDTTYIFDGSIWMDSDNNEFSYQDRIVLYLLNAYYEITDEITISDKDYVGLGTLNNPFSGVIVGNAGTIKVNIAVKSANTIENFGGLITYSRGSVVKDLILDYSDAEITMTNFNKPSTKYNPFFGGVVGYCMGGDTIIDNVSVSYGSVSDSSPITLSGSNGYDRLIAVGGYVGLAGGAVQTSNITDNKKYEKTGGGVVFRNMSGRGNPFSGDMSTKSDGNSKYFYCNPFVGRVLDGYACYDTGVEESSTNSTIDNTDKNYTIPDLSSGTSDLIVNSNFEVTVNSAQGLWLLSAIVNSGAGAMDSKGFYSDYEDYVDAYQYGKMRSGVYDKVGKADGKTDLVDEAWWGGIKYSTTQRVSYLVKKFTNFDGESYYAARVSGSSQEKGSKPNNAVSLKFGLNIDMSKYGSGFRGIGESYGNMKGNMNDEVKYCWRRNLLVSSITSTSGYSEESHITLKMDQKVYGYESISSNSDSDCKGAWFNKGAGLFTTFMCTENCSVGNLVLSGDVKFTYYDENGNTTYAFGSNGNGFSSCVGGFAGRMSSQTDSSSVIFDSFSLDGLKVGGIKLGNTVTGGSVYTGGVFGYVDGTGTNNVTFSTWPVSSTDDALQVATNGLNVCYTGALIGGYNGTGILTIGPADNSSAPETTTRWDVNVSNITVYSRMEQREATEACLGFLVGRIGNSENSTICVQNITFTGLKVDALRTANVGGLIGQCQSSTKQVTIRNVTMTNLSASSTNCQNQYNSLKSDHTYYGLGGLIGCNAANTTIDNVRIDGTTQIYSNYDSSETAKPMSGEEKLEWFNINVGGFIGNSEEKYGAKTVIQNSTITGTKDTPVKILIYSTRNSAENGKGCAAGGFFGYDKMGDTVITNSNMSYVNILAPVCPAALIGHKNYNGLNASNIIIDHCNVALLKANGNKSTCYAGLVTGYTWSVINAYNILAQSTNIGCFDGWNTDPQEVLNTMNVMNESNMGLYSGSDFYNYSQIKEMTNPYTTVSNSIGIWLGQKGKSEQVKLLAVACDKNCNTPLSNIGKANLKPNMYVVYADYPADQTNQPSGKTNPWLDINPGSGVKVTDSENTATMLTGNGVGMMKTSDGSAISVPKMILQDAQTDNYDGCYYNLKDGTDKVFSKLLEAEQNVHVSTYKLEDSQAVCPVDFPVLVINSNTQRETVNTSIWNYIAALTNADKEYQSSSPISDYATAAQNLTPTIMVQTYQWAAEAEAFATVNQNSLNYNASSKDFALSGSNIYDNTNNQITLVDVSYTDPTNSSNAYHLYIPVLVKKILYMKTTAKMLAGTNGYAGSYSNVKNTDYATVGIGEPVTAYIEYNYERTKEEWQAALDNGENLLWYYHKKADLGEIIQGGTELPAGTRLTLVDKQTSQVYTYQLTESDIASKTHHNFDFDKFITPDRVAFEPTPICELLNISTDSSANNTYVETNANDATVKIGTRYYRPKKEEDSGTEYSLKVGNVVGNDGYLTQGDAYYLTIELPTKVSTTTNLIYSCRFTYPSGEVPQADGASAPPAQIVGNEGFRYFIYDGVEQEFTMSTTRLVGESEVDENAMEAGNSINVVLTGYLRLSEVGKRYFTNYGPSQVNHQFVISMKKYIGEEASAALLGAESVTYSYQVSKMGTEGNLFREEKTLPAGSEGLVSLSIGCNAEQATKIRDVLKTDTNAELVITAEIKLNYPQLGSYFPARSESDTNSGIAVAAVSRVANVASQLPITTNKKMAEDKKHYYTKKPSNANLTYYTIDGDGTGDTTRKLGINPSDTANNLDGIIYTVGDYDYSNIDLESLRKAKQIKYTLELFQKNGDEGYGENTPLEKIDEYLSSVVIEGEQQFTVNDTKNSMMLIKNFEMDTISQRNFLKINITPLTGTAFEEKGFIYANYKVRLTAVLLDEGGNELTETKASDYIIYTNARIYQNIMQDGTTSTITP